MSEVRFSIVITCYNQQEFIKDAIESVLLQACASKEVIVVDDGSQDRSLEIIKRYETSLKLLPFSTNHGVIHARNRGASIARGEYLIFLDGDDLFTPWTLDVYERLIAARRPTTIVSLARWFEGPAPVLRKDDGVPKKLEFVEYESLMAKAKDRGNSIFIGSFVISQRAFHDVGGWSPGIWHLDGHDLYAKLAYSGNAILALTPYTMLYRMHGANSMRSVAALVGAAHLIMDREQAGRYPGGRRRRFERYTWHGGTILFCTKKALRAGFYRDAFRLAARGWAMIITKIITKSIVRLKGRRPVQPYELRPLGSVAKAPSLGAPGKISDFGTTKPREALF
jgi:glycosyltransferase involved in cell wall biosynthesis